MDVDGSDEEKSFTFDYSYWSFDQFDDIDGYLTPTSDKYADQVQFDYVKKHKYPKFPIVFRKVETDQLPISNSHLPPQKSVFDDVGVGIRENSWDGFNCSLFAYGQTGSGKSYSIIGYGPNKGIVPLYCEDLFIKMGELQAVNPENSYQVTPAGWVV